LPPARTLRCDVVARARADVFQVVVLAGDAHAFLGGRRAAVGAALQAEEGVLELHHAGIHEQERRVVARHERRRGHVRVPLRDEVVDELAAYFVGGHAYSRARGFAEQRLAGPKR
jgi:hypothetical protein